MDLGNDFFFCVSVRFDMFGVWVVKVVFRDLVLVDGSDIGGGIDGRRDGFVFGESGVGFIGGEGFVGGFGVGGFGVFGLGEEGFDLGFVDEVENIGEGCGEEEVEEDVVGCEC